TSALAKLLHLQPGAKVRHALHQADWIVGKLSGQWDISDANNCLKLGFDASNKRWPAWLEQLAVDQTILPRVFQPGTAVTTISQHIATQFGLPRNTRIVAGTTDSTAAFIATGANQVGEAVTSLGSTLVMKVISDRPIFSPRHGVYSQPLADLWLVGGGSNSGGAVLLHYFSKQQLRQMTPQLTPDHTTGLEYYPLINPGERFPVADSHKPPCLSPRPADDVVFFQAMLEGMARIEQQGYQLLAELGAPYPSNIRSAGGGSSNPAWTKIRQDLLGVPMLAAQHQQAAYGSALLARQGYSDKQGIFS
ncbi:MAG TPA: carbohydrate kinase, partial [Candidatus Tenderia electrophaga]|nr:carbohydrate kinase [Candidatus Tenderia electrophaga]